MISEDIKHIYSYILSNHRTKILRDISRYHWDKSLFLPAWWKLISKYYIR